MDDTTQQARGLGMEHWGRVFVRVGLGSMLGFIVFAPALHRADTAWGALIGIVFVIPGVLMQRHARSSAARRK